MCYNSVFFLFFTLRAVARMGPCVPFVPALFVLRLFTAPARSLNNCSYCVLYFRIISYIVLVLYEPYPIKPLKKSAMVCRSVFSLFYLLPRYVPTCLCVCLSISLPSCYPLTCLFCLSTVLL